VVTLSDGRHNACGSASGGSLRWPIHHEVHTYVIYRGHEFSLKSLRSSARLGVGWQ
jgi:hypothetical protein